MPDIHFECPKCKQTLDAPEELATQLIDCPTCKETIEVPVRSQRTEAPKPPEPPKPVLPPIPSPQVVQKPPTVSRAQTQSSTNPFAVFLFIVSAGLIGIGGLFAVCGFLDDVHESTLAEGSAIRQTVYAIQEGSGLTVVALGFILSALTGILNKRSH